MQSTGFEAAVLVPNAADVVARIPAKAKACYERFSADRRDAGIVKLIIRLSSTGAVTGVTAPSNSGVSKGVLSCVNSFVNTLHFAPPGPHGSALAVKLKFLRTKSRE